jgi:uncharacterized membrane protein YhaH (DUF805 family)
MAPTSPANPYATPRAAVADVAVDGDVQPVRLWPPDGRIGRLRYVAYSIAASLVLMVALAVLGGVSGAMRSSGLMLAAMAVGYAAAIAFSIVLTIQRCHDMNLTGWLSVLWIVPLVNFVFLLVPGTQGPNRFGPPPPPNTRGVKLLASLVLVFFVLGIVAAVAVPAYMQYTMRARAAQMK